MTTAFGHGKLRGLRLVVAAENADILDLLKAILNMCGSHSLAVGTSSAADVVLEHFRPDALLVALPLLDFDHVLLRHAATAQIPVVAIDVDRAQIWSGELFMSGVQLTVVKRIYMDDVVDGVLTAIARGAA